VPPKHKILVIDDEEVVLDSCTQILDGGDCRINTASNGAEGLKRLEDLEPDVVFLDLKMPGLDGYAVLEQLKRNKNTRDIPVIVMTASITDDKGRRERAIALGAAKFLTKPFSIPGLLDEVSKTLQSRDKSPERPVKTTEKASRKK